MGLGDKARERREAADLASWEVERARVLAFITRTQTFVGATNADVPTLPIQLPEGEHALLVLPGVQLIEPRRLPAHFMGGNNGFTFHVTRAPRAGSGPGAGDPVPIDTGVVTVTDRRAVFSGSLHTRTWDYATVIGFHTHAEPPWTAIAVSDRQRVSGLRYDATQAEEFRFALALGLARFHRSEASLIDDLHRQLEELDRERPGFVRVADAASSGPAPLVTGGTEAPGVPAPTSFGSSASPVRAATAGNPLDQGTSAASVPTGTPPPGWYPDPYRTARLRWWDGRAWTGHAAP